MKVCFVNPPAADGVKQVREGRCMQRSGAWTAIWTPISLALCAQVVRKEGIDVKLSDCIIENIDFLDLQKMVREYLPQLIVLNVVTPSIESDLSTIKLIKEVDRNIKTAIIGIHGTALPEDCLKLSGDLDCVIRGEPEHAVRDIALAVKEKRDFSEIKGITYRADGRIINNPDREVIENLDELPFPAWDLIKKEKYKMPFTGNQFLLIATSRGCPYRCVFCADNTYYGRRLRLRTPKSIVDELEWNKREFHIKDFLFWTESFTINRDFSFGVAKEIIKRGLKIRWVCNSRVDNVDSEMLGVFKEAGCWMIGYGIESGSQKTLNMVRKGTTVEQAREAVAMAKDVGLKVTAHCVIGFPGETKKDIIKTIDFAKKINIDFAQFYCAVPFPGSELYNEAVEKGWINTKDWRMFEQNYSVLDTPLIKAQEIMALRNRAYREFYFRPKIVLKVILQINNLIRLKNLILMFREFYNWIN